MDQKTSLLVHRQVPDFIRNEYPKFVSFIEAYYEFLENEQVGKNNDLLKSSKDIRTITDVDYSLEEFEKHFFDTFVNLFPSDLSVTKEVLIKNVLPVYLSKGSEKSFKLLFRMLFGDYLTIRYPKDSILRASSGKWLIENVLRTLSSVTTEYIGDGETTEFPLVQELDSNEIVVRVNNNYASEFNNKINSVYATSGIYGYDAFAYTFLGIYTPNDTTFVNTTSININKTDGVGTNLETFFDNLVFFKTFNIKFTNPSNSSEYAEFYVTNVTEFSNYVTLNVEFVQENLTGDNWTTGAIAGEYYFTVSSGLPDLLPEHYVLKESKKIVFLQAPALDDVIEIEYLNFDVNLLVNRKINGLSSGASSIIERVSERIISQNRIFNLITNSKTLLGEFSTGELLSTDVILSNGDTQTLQLKSLSEIRNIEIIDGGASYNIGDPVLIRGEATNKGIAVVENVASGLVEEIILIDGGAGYQINDEIYIDGIDESIFDGYVETIDDSGYVSPNTVTFNTDVIANVVSIVLSDPDYNFPAGGAEDINTVISDALSNTTINVGIISTANITNSQIYATTAPDFEVDGPIVANTAGVVVYLRDIGIIGKIDIISGGQDYVVGDPLVFTNLPGVYTGQGVTAEVGDVDANGSILQVLITDGGTGYVPGEFPTITVTSSLGTGADLEVNCIMGDGEVLEAFIGDEEPGQILSIKLLYPGSGYTVVPVIDLSNYGNGEAIAKAQLRNSYITLNGRWIKSEGLLSTEDIRLQGSDYYLDFSYVLNSRTEFSKYRDIYKSIVHPAGHILHTEYEIYRNIIAGNTDVAVSKPTKFTVSGTVNVNSSIYVIGTGTKFLVNETNGLLVSGNTIAVNSEIRTVDTIISNTELTVTSQFTITTNNEQLLIAS